MTNRTRITFESGGTECAGYFYCPRGGIDGGPAVACVVMGHGFNGTSSLGLPAFAERFRDAGMAVLVFDYACFGLSAGTPRQLLDVRRQLRDFRAAVRFARGHRAVDPDRIVLWGASLGGGHVLRVAAADSRIAAVICQMPFTGVTVRWLLRRPPRPTAWMIVAAALDHAAHLVNRPPRMLPVIADQGELALIGDRADRDTVRRLARRAPEWRNEFAARGLLVLLCYRPGGRATRLSMPLLVCLGDRDRSVPGTLAAAAAARAPRGELRRYPAGHFDCYEGPAFELMIEDQLSFLRRHLAA